MTIWGEQGKSRVLLVGSGGALGIVWADTAMVAGWRGLVVVRHGRLWSRIWRPSRG